MNFKKSILLGATFCLSVSSASASNWTQALADGVGLVGANAAAEGALILMNNRFNKRCGLKVDALFTVGTWIAAGNALYKAWRYSAPDTGESWGLRLPRYLNIFAAVVAGVGVPASNWLRSDDWDADNIWRNTLGTVGFWLVNKTYGWRDICPFLATPLAWVCTRNILYYVPVATYTAAYYLGKRYLSLRAAIGGAATMAVVATFITWAAQKYRTKAVPVHEVHDNQPRTNANPNNPIDPLGANPNPNQNPDPDNT
jgi:hypothetical protein